MRKWVRMYKHLTSRVLLNQWSTGTGRNRRVGVLDKATLAKDFPRTRETGGVPDTIDAPDEVEAEWNRDVEKRLPEAIGRLAGERSLRKTEVVGPLRDCIALHFARSKAAHQMMAAAIPYFAGSVADGVLAKFPASAIARALTGLAVPPGSAEIVVRDRIGELLAQELINDRFHDGVYMDNYRKAKADVLKYDLEVWHCAAGNFILADTPVATDGGDESRVGVAAGVPWTSSKAIWMPVSPHHVIALSKEPRWIEADRGAVILLNRRQATMALDSIYFHPEFGPIDEIMAAFELGDGETS
jgi:hypothetical protein